MKRIIRLNAVENTCPAMLLGMNQHSLHPKESLSPQKLTIAGVSFSSLILAFLNALNINNVTTLFALNIAFENIRLFNALLPSLINRSCKVLSSLVCSVSTIFMITWEMEVRRKIQQVRIYLNQPQLDLVKALNCIKTKFGKPPLLPFHPPRQFWGVMSLYMVIKSWKAKKVAVLAKNLWLIVLLTIFNQQEKVEALVSSLINSNYKKIYERVAYN